MGGGGSFLVQLFGALYGALYALLFIVLLRLFLKILGVDSRFLAT